jgi:hypothetical protein
MIYNIGLPFSFFEHSSVKAFLKHLQPAYVPSTRHYLANILLKDCYKAIKTEVKEYIKI